MQFQKLTPEFPTGDSAVVDEFRDCKLHLSEAQLGLDFDAIDKKRALVTEARVTFGVAAARQLWIALGLPQISKRERSQGRDLALQAFDRFLRECTVSDDAAEVRSKDLHQRYMLWARSAGAPPLTATFFGKLAGRCGIPCRKSGTTIYIGLALRPGRGR